MARLAIFILSDELRGDGKLRVARRVQQLFTLDGYLVAEYDPFGVEHQDGTYEPTSFARDLDKGV